VIFSYVLTLLGVCGLAVGSLVVLRAARGWGLSLSAAQPIRIVGRQAVGTGSTLILVEVDGERLLIGVSRGGIAVLPNTAPFVPSAVEAAFRPRSLDFARDERRPGSFRATLRRAGERW
jgi:flagellar biogenesis protein FliO